jgi:hypothetical protein
VTLGLVSRHADHLLHSWGEEIFNHYNIKKYKNHF